ncbi:hypothetical protein LDL49_56065 [Nonomuraea sp. NEAU-L178]|nr:hypothetical protein [Nonomuraea aurantiaca]
MIGDSKLISYANLATMAGEQVTFIAPASKTYVPAAALALDLAAAIEVGYVAARDTGKTAEQRGTWRTDATVRSPSSTMRMASSLNSGENCLRRLVTYLPLPDFRQLM